MTLKEKMKTYNFWVSLVSCLLLLAKVIAEQFGYSLSPSLSTNIATIVCAVLVLFGLISAPGKKVNLKELEVETKQMLQQNNELISQIKEETTKSMEEMQEMTIAEQIEFLKNKLAEAELKREAEIQEEMIAAETEAETAPKIEEVEALKEQEEPSEKEPAEQKENKLDISSLSTAELKEVLVQILQRL